MKKKSNFLFFKTLVFSVFLSVFAFIITASVFGASAELESSAVTASQKDSLSGNALIITLEKAEIDILKDAITVTLDGAKWEDYADEGQFDTNAAYKKISDYELEIHIDPTEIISENDLTVSVPLNCVVLYDQPEISAAVSYNADGYTGGRYVFAKCSYSKATLIGNVMERKISEDVFASKGTAYYNKLNIYVLGNDVPRVKDTITITLEGMTWSRLGDSGSFKNNGGVSILYNKINQNTISLRLMNYKPHMAYAGFNIAVPLTGTVTDTGELKAIVDFGVEGTVPSEVLFGYCIGGDITLTSDSPGTTVNNAGKVSNMTIKDTTEQSFKKDTKFTLTLQEIYDFYQVPKINGTGKYADKCSVEISPNNRKQIIITMTDAVPNETGTIELTDVIIEKSALNIPKSKNLTAAFEGTGWEDYKSAVSIGKYSADAEYNPPLRMSAENMNVQVKDYIKASAITFTDNGTDRSYSAGDKIVMTFDNDFYWYTEGTTPVLTAAGKFYGACKFYFSTENNNEAYIVFKKDVTSQSEGTITLNSVYAVRDSEEYFPTLNMTAYIDGEPTTSNTLQLGRYYAAQTGSIETAIAEEEMPAESSGEAIEVKLAVGQESYYIDDEETTLSAAPYIKEGHIMLPVRILANLAGIEDEDITYADGSAAFDIDGTEAFVISPGEPVFTLMGQETELLTSAEVINGTMFMPLRNLVSALGIPAEDVSFDSDAKTVTIIFSS